MNLGQRIYELRKAKNLSQGELADMLEVSRQSISKWENDTSVPELDKLVKMSDIFGVSLDSIIKGTNDETNTEAPAKATAFVPSPSPNQTQKIIGAILLSVGLLAFLIFSVLGGILSGLLFSSPFISCGIICLTVKRRAGLWCAWAVYFLVDVYLSWATSISRSQILLTFIWTEEMNFAILYSAWISTVCLAGLIVATLISFRKFLFKPNIKDIVKIAIIIIVTVIFGIFCLLYGNHLNESLINSEYKAWETEMGLFRVLSFVNSWLKITAITVTLNSIIGYIRLKRSQK